MSKVTSKKQKIVRKKTKSSKHTLEKGSQGGDESKEASLAQGATPEPNESQSLEANSSTTTPSKSKKRKGKTNKNVKDPSEASAYLSAWKHRDAGGVWKFNKNTQSWLVRHMYEPEKISKTTFGVLLEYLTGLKGQMRARVYDDACRRSRRYKEYEKGVDGSVSNLDSGTKSVDVMENPSETSTNGKQSVVGEDDESRWKRLDDHAKRKEYKRARKVIETLVSE